MPAGNPNPTLAKPIPIACAWTVLVEFVGLWLAGVLGIDYRLAGLSLIFGWLPIVVVAARRPQKPSTTDALAMFAGYPVLFGVVAAFSRWYF